MNMDSPYNMIISGALGIFTLGLYLYLSKNKKNPKKEKHINDKDKEEGKNNFAPDLKIEDFPPANVINPNFEAKNYPIIRCENCHEIPTIKFNLDKKEIQLKCEKEEKIENIPFKNFFKTLNKYKDINCCQLFKNKNPLQKYYLCTTCSNKVLCQKCFEVHNKDEDIIKLKIDSTCKKHNNPYESYCPICKENKCSYCEIDHDKKHEIEEILLKKKLLKKNELDEFRSSINKN